MEINIDEINIDINWPSPALHTGWVLDKSQVANMM